MPSTLLPPAKALQRKLVLNDSATLVLATIETARLMLPGHDEDDILSLIQEGALPWTWNIALDPSNTAREIRILPDCIDHYARTGGSRQFGLRNLNFLIAHRLLPETHKPFVLSTRLRLLFNCSATHITNLVDANILEELAGTKYRRGPNGAACITRASATKFLEQRLEGAL
jgi:hypothetical protein